MLDEDDCEGRMELGRSVVAGESKDVGRAVVTWSADASNDCKDVLSMELDTKVASDVDAGNDGTSRDSVTLTVEAEVVRCMSGESADDDDEAVETLT